MANEIKTLSLKQLEGVTRELGQPKFRAKQLYEWLHTHRVASYDEMTNLPKAFRDQLARQYPLSFATVVDKQVSADGTRKYILQFPDGAQVETVGIPSTASDSPSEAKRLTVCFSTQVGCAMECAFCATGKEGFSRNLTSMEMVEQIIAVERDFGRRVTNVVAMGQGEPFLNYDETLDALREINNPDGLNIGARHITVSTCGVIRGIERLASEPEQFTLAVSLHSAIQSTRDAIMPRVANQKLPELKRALSRYIQRTNRRITFEYLLMSGINDSGSDLSALLDFCDGLLCHVNILPMNAVKGSPFQPASHGTVALWQSKLNAAGIEATLRHSRGSDIAGACGQLKNSFNKAKRSS